MEKIHARALLIFKLFIFFFEIVKTLKYTYRKWHSVEPQLYGSRSGIKLTMILYVELLVC